MGKTLIFLLAILSLCFVGCSTLVQSYKPNIVEVGHYSDIPLGDDNIMPVYLNSADANGLYYMDVEYTNDLPEFGWVVVNSGNLIHIVMAAYPKPSPSYHIVGVAKEPAYKVLNQ